MADQISHRHVTDGVVHELDEFKNRGEDHKEKGVFADVNTDVEENSEEDVADEIENPRNDQKGKEKGIVPDAIAVAIADGVIDELENPSKIMKLKKEDKGKGIAVADGGDVQQISKEEGGIYPPPLAACSAAAHPLSGWLEPSSHDRQTCAIVNNSIITSTPPPPPPPPSPPPPPKVHPLFFQVRQEKEETSLISTKRRKKLSPIQIIKMLSPLKAIQRSSPPPPPPRNNIIIHPQQQNPNNYSSALKEYEHPDTRLTLSLPATSEMNLAEFLNFAKSLDRVFHQPAGTIDSNFLFNNYDSSRSIPDVVDLRRRLSSLLPINYRIFADAEKLAELSIFSTKLLLGDNSLSAFQVSILKRMEQLPAMSKSIFEIKELADDLENLIFSFQFNMSKASSLWTEYHNSRQRLISLQAEVEANDGTLQEIDEQIAKLRVRRFELQSLGEVKRKEVMDLSCSHNNIVNNLAKAIEKIKAAYMTTQILNSEKKCLIDRSLH